MVGERMAVARIFPTVAGDFVSPSNSSCRQHYGFGAEQVKSAALAVVSKRTCDAAALLQQRDDCVFHENVKSQMDSMVLKSADHFQAGAVAHVGKPRIPMAAEISLENSAVARAIKKCAPRLQFAHACRSFLGVQFRHPPVTQILTAAHHVGKMNAPAIPVVYISHRHGYTSL